MVVTMKRKIFSLNGSQDQSKSNRKRSLRMDDDSIASDDEDGMISSPDHHDSDDGNRNKKDKATVDEKHIRLARDY